MARISIGPSSGSAKLNFEANLAHNSSFEIEVGEGRDMSHRQIKVLERNAVELAGALDQFDQALRSVVTNEPNMEKGRLNEEAGKFREGASAVVQDKRWRSISLSGVLAAAAAVGASATPLVELSLKIAELLKAIYGA